MEALSKEWFKEYYLNLQHQWLQRSPADNYAYYEAWQAYMAQAAAHHQPAPPASTQSQGQHLPPPPPAATEDEEANQGPAGEDSPQVRAYIAIFRDLIGGAGASPAQQPSRNMSVDSSSDTTPSQAGTSFQNTTVHGYEPEPSTSSFNPYGEHSSHPAYGFTPSTTNGDTQHSGACDEPTDLSMPKRNHHEANHTDAYDSDDSDDYDDDVHSPMQPGSPIRYPTYTHLSDVSNDSVDDGGKKQQTDSYPDDGTGKRAYSVFVTPPPNDCLQLYANAILGEAEEKVRKVFGCCRTALKRNLPANKAKKIMSLMLAEIKKNSEQIRFGEDVRSKSNLEEDTETNGNGERHRNPNEEGEIIDLSDGDHMDAADSGQEAGPSSPRVEQEAPASPDIEQAIPGPSAPHTDHVQPLEPQAMYSIPEKPPPPAQLSPTPPQECVLPDQLDDAHMESAATSDENGLEAMVRTADMLSGSPADLLPHDHPMELLYVAETTPAPEQSPRAVSPSVPGTSQSLVASSTSCERKSREPWYNRSLLSFVAKYAFTVPGYVWTEPKEGELRRSRRLALKHRLDVYFLRERKPPN